jgi:hypothetical protein
MEERCPSRDVFYGKVPKGALRPLVHLNLRRLRIQGCEIERRPGGVLRVWW